MGSRRTSPGLWTRCKANACRSAGMCKHSARKMQWAVHCYKVKGGRYVGVKSPRNSLVRWTKQRWRTFDGSKSGGKKRYLPASAWAHLSPDQIRRTNQSKSIGFRQGRQFVRQPRDVADIARRFRT